MILRRNSIEVQPKGWQWFAFYLEGQSYKVTLGILICSTETHHWCPTRLSIWSSFVLLLYSVKLYPQTGYNRYLLRSQHFWQTSCDEWHLII